MTDIEIVETAAPDVAIIGAGPAGLMAAEILATAGQRVTVYERMPSPARKFLMAGRGGLNLTHSEALDRFQSRYGDGADSVIAATAAFTPADVIAWAHGLGQETFVGSSGRVFPKAMKASPLLRAWLRRLEGLGVVLKTRHLWTGFDTTGTLRLRDHIGSNIQVQPGATVLALGGASWPKLGSDGTWVTVLEQAGVPIAPLTASNCGAMVQWSDVIKQRFAGAPLKRVSVRFGETIERGDLMITKSGLEGGAIYALAPLLRTALSDSQSLFLSIDLKPDMTEADLAARLARIKPGQSLSNTLRKAAALDEAAIGFARETTVPRTAIDLARHLKAVPVTIVGLAPIDRAISTAGGVAMSAIDADFMLRAAPGIFVAGEMLDWDAPTGGYLLQASFATGAAAAKGALQWLAMRDKAGRRS